MDGPAKCYLSAKKGMRIIDCKTEFNISVSSKGKDATWLLLDTVCQGSLI